MTEMQELAPCPFCGGPGMFEGEEGAGYEVVCQHCGARSGWGDYGYQAEASWNRRAPSKAILTLERERDEAREAVDAFADICDELGCERDNEAGLQAAHDLKARATAAEAQVQALREALEPFGPIADAVLSEAPHDATKAKLWNGIDNSPLYISLDACRMLIAALRSEP